MKCVFRLLLPYPSMDHPRYVRSSHCVYLCDYHLVLPTKYRRSVINAGVWGYLEQKLLEVVAHYPKLYIKEMNHDKNHIHLLISIPPQESVGSVVRIIKSNTSKGIKSTFPFLKQVYWGTNAFWSEGYFVSTVGINASIISRYIQQQWAEDENKTAQLFWTSRNPERKLEGFSFLMQVAGCPKRMFVC